MLRRLLAASIFSASAVIIGCHAQHETSIVMVDNVTSAEVQIKPSKAATTQPLNNNVTGYINFAQTGSKVHITGAFNGLAPNTKHGIHIHENGDLSAPDLSSAGGHFNPDHHMHGGPTTSPVHAGDLGNLQADINGHATIDLTVNNVTVGTGAANDVVGRSVIIHAKPDDFMTQPAGNSRPRVAGGVIEIGVRN